MSPSRLPERIVVAGLEFDARTTVATVVGTLLITVDFYYRLLPAAGPAARLRATAIERVGLYLLVPLALIRLFGDRPADYGWQRGDWRRGLVLALGSAAIAGPFLYFAAQDPAMVKYYALTTRSVGEVLAVSALDLIGWEFFFRGFLLFVLARQLGPTAIVVQAVPFALAHLGKPPLETLTTVFGGAYFGWIAWRTRSFLYPFLLHWLINAVVRLAAMGTF